ncbi:MAG: bacillithiol biosynthesis protein BshC [Candidatus Thorarchaeota archaeon]
MKASIIDVYQQFIWKDELNDLAKYLYDSPVITMGAIVEKAPGLLQRYSKTDWHSEERVEKTGKAIEEANRRLGTLTPKVKDAIDLLQDGAVEAAHQSVVLGGPCYILNKAATAKSVASFGSSNDLQLTPYFFIADHDIVQAELTNIRTPNAGHEGNLVSVPVEPGYEHSPVSVVPLPGRKWYEQAEDSVRSSYRPLLKSLEHHARTLVEERLEHSLTLTRWAYHNSRTLGEWGQRIIGRLLNLEGDLGIPLLSATDTTVRKLMTEGLELLLARENRERFLVAHERATSLIGDQGFRAGIGIRNRSFVPFFFECQGKDCNRARIELSYSVNGTKALLTGKCPVCNEAVEIEVDADSPDLSSVSESLSFRVDTRQVAVDTLLPVVAHVGGPGETAYHAQVIPAVKALDIPFPLFIRYPRVYFNTPWNEELARILKEKEFPVVQDPEMFKYLGKIGRFRKKRRFDEMNTALTEFEDALFDIHSELNKRHAKLETQKNNGNADEGLLLTKLDVEKYLSWVFGQFTRGKLSQESTWSWIEWALNAGFSDLFGPYFRAHVEEMKNGATYFVNFIL